MTPAAALKLYKNAMSLFEQVDILDYAQVYFVGHKAKKPRATASSADNNGFDDERGDYLWNLNDHIGFRYEILGVLGKGSFGQVLKCFDWKTNQLTAFKVIRNKKRFHQQALVECKLLLQLKQRDTDSTASVVHVTDHFYFRSHMCITFEMLSINLYEFIKNNKFQGMSLSLVRRIALQLANSLKFLRKQNIIHCDLKPENVLLRSPNKSSIKVIDFGSSCLVTERLYTYIQSRFYRAPEVILGLPYDTAIDMWSFGCILAELFTGYPIFPGENEVRLRARGNANIRFWRIFAHPSFVNFFSRDHHVLLFSCCLSLSAQGGQLACQMEP
jgi:serine/threonine protein kinase